MFVRLADFWSPSTAAGRFDNENIPRRAVHLIHTPQHRRRTALMPHPLDTLSPRPATRSPTRRKNPRLRDHTNLNILEKLPLAPNAAPAAPLALATRPGNQTELHKTHRNTALKHLGICDPRVGHVDVDAIRASVTRSRTAPTRKRLINTKVRVAEEDVVHRRLTRCANSDRIEECIHNSLAHLGVPTDHRRARRRISAKDRIDE
jgi:hypothetical protein